MISSLVRDFAAMFVPDSKSIRTNIQGRVNVSENDFIKITESDLYK